MQFNSDSYSTSESDGTVTITVTRSNGASGAVTVDYISADNTATQPADYSTASGTLSWADSEIGDKTFTVTINQDSDIESDETVTLTLINEFGANPGTTLSASLTITNVSENLVAESDTIAVLFKDSVLQAAISYGMNR